MDEPSGSSVMVSVAKGIMVYGWVWRRQPLPRNPLRLVACEEVSVAADTGFHRDDERLSLFIMLALSCKMTGVLN